MVVLVESCSCYLLVKKINVFVLFSLEVTNNDFTNYDRLTHFLGCSREILGSSSVLCLSFALKHEKEQDEADSPLGLMTGLSRRGNVWVMLNLRNYTSLCSNVCPLIHNGC